jgi:hypothetical protein
VTAFVRGAAQYKKANVRVVAGDVLDAAAVDGIAQSLQAVRDGRAVMLTDTVKSVMGKKPIAFKAWLEQRAALFE